ncbi:protein mono-ADP-ribosyltransferase PARP11-like isoform X1 [Megalops cyprinoides]|uniref:protein mono-ADP-ribosyltransferase PARP11-like isoform X1 n=2 Tax=Megalops cyprinoides TaxID=118141 RepID=UPI00186492FE|nr:protein mono-ADP-ribosyltransferase PARP11-like isoform X1 [Megalops cyprinoides]
MKLFLLYLNLSIQRCLQKRTPTHSRFTFVAWTAQGTFYNPKDTDMSQARWRWFYLAECGMWHMFQVNPSKECSLTSDCIERKYVRNQQGIAEYSIAGYIYLFDFLDMKQINMTTGKDRPIKRVLHSDTGFRCICNTIALPSPAHQEKITPDEPYQIIPLDRDTREFKSVKKLFAETMPDADIYSIQRIQNSHLWECFRRKREQLSTTKKTTLDEKKLFHGTDRRNIKSICAYNFDLRFSGSNGNLLGNGVYFAKHASYANHFCRNEKHNGTPSLKAMILARVLVGEFTLGEKGICRVPTKNWTKREFYDSCVDEFAHPKVFVVFDSNQVYPEYVIEFY